MACHTAESRYNNPHLVSILPSEKLEDIVLELAQLIHQIASDPSILADSATFTAFLKTTSLGVDEMHALLEVLREFDWQQMHGAEVVEMLSEAAGWPDPRGDWVQ